MIAAIKDKRKSVSFILKEIGKPTETSTLVNKFAEANGISKPQAYREVSKAWKNKQIRKVTLPDRSVLNLLPEWNLPSEKDALSFEETFIYDCFRKLDRIGDLNTENSRKAMLQIRSLIMRLPKKFRQEVMPFYLKASKSLWKRWNKEVRGFLPPLTGAAEVDFMIGRISQLLHRQVSGEKVQ